MGKGSRKRVVPIDQAFFSECAAYLRAERPSGLATQECFCYVDDEVSGILALLASGYTGPVNIGNPTEHNMLAWSKVLRITAPPS